MPRQQLNEITAWVDGSNVYGSNQERADALRTLDGTGKLKTSDGNMLPFNVDGLPNAGGSGPNLFLAGDVRANEQLGLTAMHTLFVREHNRLAEKIGAQRSNWDGDRIYEKARQLVGAQIQVITYNEFLPALLGKRAMRKNIGKYRGYRSNTNAGIANMFSTGAYRFGHSAISVLLKRVEADGSESPFGHLELRNAFFRPDRLNSEGGIEPILRGLSTQAMQAVDAQVVDELRNFLFGDPNAGGLDLAALNIQRGRDHGLPSYNDTREANGFGRATDWSDITSNTDMQERLYLTYSSVDDVDLWVNGLFEDAQRGSHLGPLFTKLVSQQFKYLRDGDRYWYRNKLTPVEVYLVEATSLAKVIRRNTEIGMELRNNIFKAQDLRPLLTEVEVRGKRRSPFGRPRGITISKRVRKTSRKASSDNRRRRRR